MTQIDSCNVENCAYNSGKTCHAIAITVGGPHQECDTFLESSQKGGEKNSVSGIGACRIEDCVFNRSFLCGADRIKIGPHETHADCLSYSRKK